MSFLTGRASVVRSALRPAFFTAPRANLQVRFATQDYGSGKGNPAGETPEKQGKNPSEHLEHPGPAPPKVAEGKSSSSPNQDGQSSSSTQSTSSQSQSNDGAAQKGSGGQSVKGAQPKILNESAPSKEEQSEDVARHNREMENRTEKAHEQARSEDSKDEKVSKDFWKGKCCT